jgi:hypothetical protein
MSQHYLPNNYVNLSKSPSHLSQTTLLPSSSKSTSVHLYRGYLHALNSLSQITTSHNNYYSHPLSSPIKLNTLLSF